MAKEFISRRRGVALVLAAVMAGLAWPAQGGADAGPAPAAASSSEADGAPARYQDWFTDAAMRVDLFHTGTANESVYSMDEVVFEPSWPGTRRYLIDPFDFGTYRFRVTDHESGREIFRQGFATLFEEWTGTEEAASGGRRTMGESVRFPWPRKPVVVHVDKRTRAGNFREMYALRVDPDSHLISRVRPFADVEVLDLTAGPPPERALDIVILPEGYARDDEAKLRADLARFAERLNSHEPWRSLRDRVHIRGLLAYSPESGVTEPRKGVFRDTLLGASFNTFDSPRYLTLMHTKRMRQLAAVAPYDSTFVMVNSSRYGGGGVYNQWSVFTSDNEYDDYVMLHEFGHHMGGLGDEYYSSAMTIDEDALYPPGYEPWEPNITAFLGKSRERIKWGGLIAPDTPVPTPEEDRYSGVVGLFEGAGYKAKGLYRPQADCKMFHKGLVEFCAVCRKSIEAMTRYYAGEDLQR